MAAGHTTPARERNSVVGRALELGIGERALTASDSVGVLFLHGPGGIGKSAIARELAHRADERGRPVWHVDGREVPPHPEALADALEGIYAAARALLVLDSFELIEASAAYLREDLLPALPEGTGVVIASRNAPDAGWLSEGLDARFVDLRVGPLTPDDAERVVAEGEIDADRGARVVEWAAGHPLALRLGSRIAAADPDWTPGSELASDELVRALVRQLGEVDMAAGRYPALAAAAVARSTTPALLAAALPEHDPAAEWEWLSARSFVEPVGEGVALHAVLRDAMRTDLKRRNPTLEAALRKRIADHVYQVAVRSGELGKVLDLSHLIEHMGLRWFVWEVNATYFLDSPRPGDVERIDRLLDDPAVEPIGGGEKTWAVHRPLFDRMPELGTVVKDATGQIRGFTVVATTAADDAELEASPVIGRCLEHARTLEPRGEAVIMPFMCDLTGDPLSGVIGMLANAALLRASRSNPRYTYMTIGERIEFGQRFAEYAGAERLPELDIELGSNRLLAWLLDYGPGGFVAHQRDLVYRELGLEPPPRPPERIESVRAEEIRDALRNIRSPATLARSPLARGSGPEERASSVRALLTDATARAFGDDQVDRLLRDTLVHGYLEPVGSHELAAQRVHLSRSAYFRRLAQAVDRLADYLLAGG